MTGPKFATCSHCGNQIELIRDAGVPVLCCGQPMDIPEPNTVEASGEKHLPVVAVEDGVVTVNVGAVDHPMIDVHYIEWVYLQTENGGQRRDLHPEDAPHVTFHLGNEKPVAVYAYCNLHGLWMTKV